MKSKYQYVAFLRGINVGGHHKVPMAQLQVALKKLGFTNIAIILNSGNIVFDADSDNRKELEETIAQHLEKSFGFPIPTIIRTVQQIKQLYQDSPFDNITISKDIRLYVSLLKQKTQNDLKLPWSNDDKSFSILAIKNNIIISVLDLAIAKTPKAMNVFEKFYGKDLTTRNWKTIGRIVKKCS